MSRGITVTPSTKSKPRSKQKVTNYNDIRDKKSSKGSRGYHLSAEQKDKIRQEAKAAGRAHPNPLGNRNGAYWGSVEALIQLGANKWHRLSVIRGKMQEIMSAIPKSRKEGNKSVQSDAWTEFENKKPRDVSSPKDCLGRIEQNFRVLQRLPREGSSEKNPYGLKLAQFGMTVDIKFEKEHGVDVPYIMLNTKWDDDDTGMSVEPLKGRKPRKVRAKAEVDSDAPKPKKASSKKKSPKKKAEKPKQDVEAVTDDSDLSSTEELESDVVPDGYEVLDSEETQEIDDSVLEDAQDIIPDAINSDFDDEEWEEV